MQKPGKIQLRARLILSVGGSHAACHSTLATLRWMDVVCPEVTTMESGNRKME